MEPKIFSEFLAERRSTRSFKSKAVAPELIEAIIQDGLTSPSWSNTRPIMVAVASGEVRDRMSAEFLKRWDVVKVARRSKWGLFKLLFTRYGLPTSNAMIAKPYSADLLPRAQKIGAALYSHLGIDRKDRVARDNSWAENYEFFGAPTELFIFSHKTLGKFSANDAGMFVMNLMLGAKVRGLGTCAQGAVAVYEDIVRSEFDVPRQYQLLYGIAVGYPSDEKVNRFQAARLTPAEITIPPKK